MADPVDIEAVADRGPGVHVVVHPDPHEGARAVARAIGGVVVDMPVLAEPAIASRCRLPAARAARSRLDRLEALAADSAVATTVENDVVVTISGRRAELATLARRRVPDDITARRLHAIAKELRSLERVRAVTEAADHERSARQLGVPVEPGLADRIQALRTAAATLRAAEAALDDARLGLTLVVEPRQGDAVPQHSDEPRREQFADALREAASPTDLDDEATPLWDPSRIAGRTHDAQGSVLMPIGIFCLGLFCACVVLLFKLPGPAAAVPVVAALLLASAVRRSILADARERREATATTEAPSAATAVVDAEPPEPSTDVRPVVAAVLLEDERSRRRAVLTAAEGRLADARRAWAELAGPTSDPGSVEDVIAGRMPGRPPTGGLMATASASRAVAAVHRRLRAEWRVAWARLGCPAPPPDPDVIDRVLADLEAASPVVDEARALLAHLEAAEGRGDRREQLIQLLGADDLDELRAQRPPDDDLEDDPLVLVSPFNDLAESARRSLRDRFDQLPPDVQVVIVVASADDVPPLGG